MTAPRRHRAPDFPYATRWQAALADFADDYGHLASSTRARISKHTLRFAATVETRPYDVTSAQIADWLDTLTCSTPARYAYGTSLRTFYRWALQAGRITADPTAGPSSHEHLRRPAPPEWEEALRGWARYLRAAGQPNTTIQTRLWHLRRLGREIGAAPWEVDAGELVDWLAGHQWAPSTARNVRSALRGFYRWAVDLGHTADNPALALPTVRTPPPVPRPADEDAYHAALTKAAPRERMMLRLSAELGLRRAEVAAVHTSDLHTDALGAWLWILGKGGKTRRVPVPADLANDLARRPAGYIFPSPRGKHLRPQWVGKCVASLLPPGITMHQLRHMFATNAYARTRDVFALQQVLGHASPATTRQYVRNDDSALRALIGEAAR